jgi:hypothetical protein
MSIAAISNSIRSRFARKVIAGVAVFAAIAPLAAQSASALAPPPVNPNLKIIFPKPVPTQKALLVLLENGGYQFGLPDNATIGVPACGTFRAPYGADVWTFIVSMWDTIASLPSCLNPANWTTVQVPITQYVTGASEPVIEGATAASVTAAASPKYDKVVVLQNTNFNATRVRTELTNLAPDYVVDVHVLSHGGNLHITGGGGRIEEEDIRDFATIPNLNLRAVYQQNCFGSTLNDAWRAAGAKVVTGSNLINSMPLSYSSFLSRWLSGQTFASAVNGATADWTPFFTTVYHHVDMYTSAQVKRNPFIYDILGGGLSASDELAESAQVLQGTTSITINS